MEFHMINITYTRHCTCAHKQKRQHFHVKTTVHWWSRHCAGHISLCGIFVQMFHYAGALEWQKFNLIITSLPLPPGTPSEHYREGECEKSVKRTEETPQMFYYSQQPRGDYQLWYSFHMNICISTHIHSGIPTIFASTVKYQWNCTYWQQCLLPK